MLLCKSDVHTKAKILKICVIALLMAAGATAQVETDTSFSPKKPVIFRDKKNRNQKYRKTVGEYKLRSNGWSIGGDFIISDKKNKAPHYQSFTVYHISLGFTRSKNEARVTSYYGDFVKYGKINSLYPIELSVGKRKRLGREAVHQGVEVQWEYRGGLLLGWMLPYQITTAYGDMAEYTASTRIAYEDFDNIYAGLGSFRDLNFNSFTPGFIVESNLVFNYQIRKRLILSPVIGASLSYYTKSIPLMFEEDSGPMFLEIHLGVELGKFKIK